MRATLILTTIAAAATIFTACNDTTTIGSTLVQDKVEIVVDSTFTVSGTTIANNAVPSRTVAQLIGSIDAKGFGRLSSDVVTQFMPASEIDTKGITVNDIDSIRLVMQVNMGEYVGDSIAPLGLEVYPLTRQLPSPIYSDFNPQGYYDPNTLLGSTIYNVSALTSSDSIKKLDYRNINIKLPLDLGKKFFNKYLEDPSIFTSPTRFAEFFPGVYIKNSYGSGRVTRIAASMMRMYYHRTWYDEDRKRDTTIYKIGNYFAVTPEIITNNNISLTISPEIQARANAGENIILAPAGLDVEIRFPLAEILSSYRSQKSNASVINSLTFSIPAEKIENNYGITLPQMLLMVLSKDKETFYTKNSLPDGRTAFYAEYNPATGSYDFTNLRQYILDMSEKTDITPEDYTFTLTPVSPLYETSGYNSYYSTASKTLSAILPYVATPVMARLLLDKAKIKFTFSKQTISF